MTRNPCVHIAPLLTSFAAHGVFTDRGAAVQLDMPEGAKAHEVYDDLLREDLAKMQLHDERLQAMQEQVQHAAQLAEDDTASASAQLQKHLA